MVLIFYARVVLLLVVYIVLIVLTRGTRYYLYIYIAQDIEAQDVTLFLLVDLARFGPLLYRM